MRTSALLALIGISLASFNAWNFASAGSRVTALLWCAALPVGLIWLWQRDSARAKDDHSTLQWLILIQLALAEPAEDLAEAKGQGSASGPVCPDPGQAQE